METIQSGSKVELYFNQSDMKKAINDNVEFYDLALLHYFSKEILEERSKLEEKGYKVDIIKRELLEGPLGFKVVFELE